MSASASIDRGETIGHIVSLINEQSYMPSNVPPLLGTVVKKSLVARKGGGYDTYEGAWTTPDGEILDVAIKCVGRTDRDPGMELIQRRIALETFVSLKAPHQNILRFLGYQVVDESVVLVSPFCHNGSIEQHLEANPMLTRTERLRYLSSIARALSHLHNVYPPVVHGGITPRSVLITRDKRAVLRNFRRARIVGDRGSDTGDWTGGDAAYLAPELISGDLPTFMTDVYAFGGLILAIMSGEGPFQKVHSQAKVEIHISCGNTPKPCDHPQLKEEDPLWDLMRRCWEREPNKRPSMGQIVSEIENLICQEEEAPPAWGGMFLSQGSTARGPSEPQGPGIDSSTRGQNYGGGGSGGGGRKRALLLKRLQHEAAVWQAVSSRNHENIVPFFGWRTVDEVPALISPLYKNGDLVSYIRGNPESTYTARLTLVHDVARGLGFLHSRKDPIAHGDINPRNVMVTDKLGAALCGFSNSRIMSAKDEDSYFDVNERERPLSGYLAKELVMEDNPRPTPQADIFAFGGLALETMTGKAPFYHCPTAAAIIISIYEDNTPSHKDHSELAEKDPLWGLMMKCWNPSPDMRSPMTQVVYEIMQILLLGRYLVEPTRLTPIVSMALADPTKETVQPPEMHQLEGTLILGPFIAKGGFGSVHRGQWSLPGRAPTPVAIKKIDLSKEVGEKDIALKRIKRETFIWKAAQHPNILPFYGYQIGEERPLLVSPWCANGNLADYLQKNPDLTEQKKLELLRGAASGLNYLHSLKPPILHGDIKPQNVVLNDDLEALLCDFGISKINTIGGGTGMTTQGIAGTHGYQAKELYAGNLPPTDRSDVYAFGGLTLATMTGSPPFHKLLPNVARIVILVYTDQTPVPADHPVLHAKDQLWGLMRRCWNGEPLKRPSMTQVEAELNKEIKRRSEPKVAARTKKPIYWR